VRRGYVYCPRDKEIEIPEDYARIDIGINDWARAIARLRNALQEKGETKKELF